MKEIPETLIYSLKKNKGLEKLKCIGDKQSLIFKIWKPTFVNYLPFGYGKKYILFWFFHYLKIFKNSNYHTIFLFKGDELVGSLLVVPKYFKWPFMKDNDIQITYLKIKNRYRGLGYGEELMNFTLEFLKNLDYGVLWYVTDSNNLPSQKLASKLGFEFFGKGKRSLFFNSILNVIKSENIR